MQTFSMPKIQDLLQKLEGFTYATSLDLNMGYYHIELTPHAHQLCTIIMHGVNMNTVICQWDAAMPLTFFKKKCLN